VPDGDLERLGARLARAPNVVVGQHGVDHTERSRVDGRRSEYAEGATLAEMAEAIRAGRARLPKAGLDPGFYRPPWTACQPELGEALPSAGFTHLSAGADAPACPGLSYLAADLDLIRWKGRPRFRGKAKVLSALTKALRARRLRGDHARPIGLL